MRGYLLQKSKKCNYYNLKKKHQYSLAVIPARGGSKRLKNKNILKVNGHPLIAYTINAVKKSKKIDFWLVSSDDDAIIKVSKKYGANIYFKRPKKIARDNTRNSETLIHAVKFIEKKFKISLDNVLLLQPTCPIRNYKHIDKALELLEGSKYLSVASVKGPFKKRDPILKKINNKGELIDFSKFSKANKTEFFIYNASIYAIKKKYLLKEKKFVSEVQLPIFMNYFESLDIDEKNDLEIVRSLFKSNLLNKYKINE